VLFHIRVQLQKILTLKTSFTEIKFGTSLTFSKCDPLNLLQDSGRLSDDSSKKYDSDSHLVSCVLRKALLPGPMNKREFDHWIGLEYYTTALIQNFACDSFWMTCCQFAMLHVINSIILETSDGINHWKLMLSALFVSQQLGIWVFHLNLSYEYSF